jgi:cytochrome P450
MSFCPPGVDTVLVSILGEDRHAKYRRPVANAYSLSSLKEYEPYVDSTIRLFISSLTEHAEAKTVINISTSCYYYAYDIIGMLTFGKPLGFLETGHDVSGLTQLQNNSTWYAVTMFHVPWLERLIKKSGILERIGSGGFNNFVDARVQARLESKPWDPEKATKPDLLAHMIAAQGRYPDVVTDEQIAIYCADNLFAGSQSISYVLDTICEWLALYPAGQEKLYRELVDANISFSPSFTETQALPYLDGVIREGYRLHGIGFLLLERIAPKEGLKLPDGTYLPPGTIMGMPPTGLKRRKVVYGADADVFVPERWMRKKGESDEGLAARRAVMERADITFGHGSRTCIGRNIVTLEIYKLIATLVGLFQVCLSVCV